MSATLLLMNIPLLLTSSRVVLALVVGALLLLESSMPYNVAICAVLFMVAAVTDFFDGRLARAWNQKTEVGAFLDPLADKLLVYLAFIYLTVVGGYPTWLLLVVFTRDIVTDSFRAFAVGKGRSMPANMVSKWKSVFQMTSISLLLVLGGAAELGNAGYWSAVLSGFINSQAFIIAFRVANGLMIVAAVTGVLGMVQYFVEHGPSLFRAKHVRS